MRLGVHLLARVARDDGSDPVRAFHELARAADRAGFARISTGDVQGNHLECVSALTLLATATTRAGVGPQVTHPVTRDPGVLAAALASLQLISGGRAYAVLGRGDGAARNAGRPAATVAQTAQYLRAVRELLDRGVASYRGRTLRMPWPTPEPRGVRLLLAAEGPRMLELAGAEADGVVIGTGLVPAVVQASVRRFEDVARRAGRDPAALETWWTARSALAGTRAEALVKVRESLSSVGNHALRGDYAAKLVPSELHAALREYHVRYSYTDKNPARGPSRNGELMERLGLTEYFADRFGVIGSSEEVVERLRGLWDVGVRALHVAADDVAELGAYRTRVIPALDRVRPEGLVAREHRV